MWGMDKYFRDPTETIVRYLFNQNGPAFYAPISKP